MIRAVLTKHPVGEVEELLRRGNHAMAMERSAVKSASNIEA